MPTNRSIARAARRGKHSMRRTTAEQFQTFTGRVYVASPLSTFLTDRYDTQLARLQKLLPNAELVPARELFTSNADWRQQWPALLRTLDVVVFFDDDDGCIGAGTVQEICGAWSSGIPVFFLPWPPTDALIPCNESSQVTFEPVRGGGMRQTLRVCYAMSLADFLTMTEGGE
jgi:hypothetical protein